MNLGHALKTRFWYGLLGMFSKFSDEHPRHCYRGVPGGGGGGGGGGTPVTFIGEYRPPPPPAKGAANVLSHPYGLNVVVVYWKTWFSYVGKIPDDRGYYILPAVPDTVPLKSKLTLEARNSRLDRRVSKLERFEFRDARIESLDARIESRVSMIEDRGSKKLSFPKE